MEAPPDTGAAPMEATVLLPVRAPLPEAGDGAACSETPASEGGGCWEATARARFLAEVLILTVLLYYVDLVLDIVSLRQMWESGNPKLCLMNLLGIVLASLLGFALMARRISAGLGDSKEGLWVAGGLYFVQLHVLYFGAQSIVSGEVHPLLLEAKFVESTVESVVSANIQVYFMLWATLDWEAKSTIMVSVCSSFCTLAYGNAGFDLRSRGIAGVRGSETTMVSTRFLLVLVFRLCETMARVTSLALFQRACRPYGGVTVVFLDFMVMLTLTWIYGGNLFLAMPSVFGFMNPLLERHNAATLPCRVYFGVRLAEVGAMVAVALWWRGGDLVHLYEDDFEVAVGCVAGLVGMTFLLPCVRSLSKDTLLEYPDSFWTDHRFTQAESKLLGHLLSAQPGAPASASGTQEGTVQYLLLEEGPELPGDSLVQRLLVPLTQSLPPDDELSFDDADILSKVPKLLVAAQNCPTPLADEALKIKLLKVLSQLVDLEEMLKQKKPVFLREVLHDGGLTVALELAEDARASHELRQLALRLAELTLRREATGGKSPPALVERATGLALMILKEPCNPDDTGPAAAAAAQAAVVAVAVGGSAPGDLLSLGPRAIGGVLRACEGELLQYAPPQEAVREALASHGSEPFPWGDPGLKCGRKLGGLCVSWLLRQRREGEAVDLGEAPDAKRWALELRTPVEVLEGLAKALDAAVSKEDTRRALRHLRAPMRRDVEASVEAGCSVALQACFLRNDDRYFRADCMDMLGDQLEDVQTSQKNDDGPLFVKLVKSFSVPFWDGVKSLLQKAAAEEISSTDKVLTNALHALSYLSRYPPSAAILVPMMPALASLMTHSDVDNALNIVSNVSLHESLRPQLRIMEDVRNAFKQKVTEGLKQGKDQALDFDSYLSLVSLCVLLQGESDKLVEFVLQPGCLKCLIDKLNNPSHCEGDSYMESYVMVMPFPVLAAASQARAQLHEHGAVKVLCSFCVHVGLQSGNDEKAVDYAFRALTVLMNDHQHTWSTPLKDLAGDEFKELLKAAMDRTQLRPLAQQIAWLIED